MYRGYGPSVAGIVVYRAGYFGLYDFSKVYLMPHAGLQDGTILCLLTKFSLALSIDIFSALAAYPLDTVRRSMMMMSGRKDKLYTNSLQCAKYILTHNGASGFYKGALTNCIRAIGSA
uniref:ADP/ATP translocase n=1 Tax=Lygus hesperus TaxID=30085 RepID=A0A0A9WM37_LYGHE